MPFRLNVFNPYRVSNTVSVKRIAVVRFKKGFRNFSNSELKINYGNIPYAISPF